ncbi:Zinc finger, CCHC-type [Trema orientale]|uniref:Zinc finger, CCHC-type n=1 Tax=Trema orientale TaxID=63057 RepID=A0A2P5F099_TREOI|nr:Zinc finger, CCHC-type [Trema orientale]
MDEMPCIHAVAIIRDRKLISYDYCSNYYIKESLLATYEGIVYLVGNQNTWQVPKEVEEVLLLAPEGIVKSRRPKKRRNLSTWETKKSMKCGRCGQYGHNRKICRNPPKRH